MKNGTFDADILRLAKKRVWLKRTLLWHFIAYTIVNALLLLIYEITTPIGYFWPVWSMAGWGLGLVIHVIVIYFLLNNGRSQDSVNREYERLKNEQDKHK